MRRQWQTRKRQRPANPAQSEIIPRMTSRDDERTCVVCYMCAIDWAHEIGNKPNGSTLYPSIDALKTAHPMWEECGIVEVEVSIIGTICNPQC